MIGIPPEVIRPTLDYIDPVSGSLAIQAAIAGITGGIFVLRHRIALFWLRIRGHKPDAAETAPAPEAGPGDVQSDE